MIGHRFKLIIRVVDSAIVIQRDITSVTIRDGFWPATGVGIAPCFTNHPAGFINAVDVTTAYFKYEFRLIFYGEKELTSHYIQLGRKTRQCFKMSRRLLFQRKKATVGQ